VSPPRIDNDQCILITETCAYYVDSEDESIVCVIKPILDLSNEFDQSSDVAPTLLSACLLIPSFLRQSIIFPTFRYDRVAVGDDRNKSSAIFPALCSLVQVQLYYTAAVVGQVRAPFPSDEIVSVLIESSRAPSIDRS